MNHDSVVCPHAEATMRLLDGTLRDDARALAIHHVAHCPPCRELHDSVALVEGLYDTLPAPRLQPGEVSALVDIAVGPPATPLATHRRRSSVPWMAAAAILFIALGLGAYLGLFRRPPTDAPALLTSEVKRGLSDTRTVTRAYTASHLAGERLSASASAELIRILPAEPSANVRLALVDALEHATFDAADSSRLLELIATEPVPAIRIELISLVATRGIPGARPMLQRLVQEAVPVSVRLAAERALLELAT